MLTHSCLMYFLILINRTSPFPILGLWGGIFLFFSKKLLYANSGEPNQTLHFAASDLVLHPQKRTLGLGHRLSHNLLLNKLGRRDKMQGFAKH